MSEAELIAKQQLEIESLKLKIAEIKAACRAASCALWRPEQWDVTCPEFPRVAMRAIVSARLALDETQEPTE